MSIPREIIANHIVPYINDVGVLNAVLNCLPRGLVSVDVTNKLKTHMATHFNTPSHSDKYNVIVPTNTTTRGMRPYIHQYSKLPNGWLHGEYKIICGTQAYKLVMYRDNKKHGCDLCFDNEHKIMYKQEYVNGLKEGLSKRYVNGQISSRTYYKGGKKHGLKIHYNNGAMVARTHYMYGKIHGSHESWNQTSGALTEVSNYVKGKFHGYFINYHDNGRACSLVNYINGYKDGRYVKYDSDGNYVEISYFKYKERSGQTFKFNGRKLVESTTYVGGVKHGLSYIWCKNGNLHKLMSFDNDNLVLCEVYNTKGQMCKRTVITYDLSVDQDDE